MLKAVGITKRFPGVLALDNVSFEFEPGKVTAIIGENGAGKSTLMKILSGVYQDYEGQILYKDKEVKFANTKAAQENGIVIIHQELNLVPWLTVQENIFLGREMTTWLDTLDKKQMRLKTEVLLKKLKLNVKADDKIADLKVGQQQVVEIAKALLYDSEVIIMDEPTSAISEGEVEVLFKIIEQLRLEGKAIVYISHKLDELFKIADNFVVLRDGKSIESGQMKNINHDQLIQKMVGREIHKLERSTKVLENNPILTVQNLCLKHPYSKGKMLLHDINLELNKGEIVGIFGLMGAGRTELLESIFGLNNGRASGNISVEGKPCNIKTVTDAINNKLALVPEDRKHDGLVLGLDIRTNMTLPILNKLEKFGFINTREEKKNVEKYIKELHIKTPSDKQLAGNLSGGNQQKIVIAKWLLTQPLVIMLDEPTRGIDIHAKTEIYKLIKQLAATGIGILMVSSELPEILAVSDRVLVMCEGAITADIKIENATEDNILKAAIGSLTA